VVDVWAPWCAPCRAIRPSLTHLAQEFSGRVDLWELNADEAPDVVSGLGIAGIPTLVVFHQGKELGRRTGMQPEDMLRELFVAAEQGSSPPPRRLSISDRVLRGGAAAFLAWLGLANGPSWWLLILAAVVAFSAVYDRCPIWRALAPRIQRAWRRQTEGGAP
jgi:thioredoxin